MFGYLVTNFDILSKEQKTNYRSFYCGLCHQLANQYGALGRTTLTYDFTFINLVLDSIFNCEDLLSKAHCPFHFLTTHQEVNNEFSKYCADMNIYLNYFKYIDDINDDNSIKAKKKKAKLEPYIKQIETCYPETCAIIKKQLELINKTEDDNVLDPFIPANQFGEIMAILMLGNKESEYSHDLKAFGYNIGKFIYIMDAVIDLKDDIKNCSYNPLVQFDSNKFEELLTNIMEDVNYYYNRLNITKNKDLIDNIIYSGIWSRYQIYLKKNKKERKAE